MKKIFTIALALFAFALAFTSCKKDPIGATAVVDASGDWFVKRIVVYANGEKEDLFGDDLLEWFGHTHLLTYNTSENKPDVIFVDDLGEWYSKGDDMFLDFKVRAKLDPATLTFSATDLNNNEYEDNTVTIEGKILPGKATTPSGMPADSIWMSVKISDDTYADVLNEYSEYYEWGIVFEQWDHFEIAGFRYTGLAKDEDDVYPFGD